MESSTSCFLGVLFVVLVGVVSSLPPFEIRSASNRRSEAAEQWIARINKSPAQKCSDDQHLFVQCPSSPGLCVYVEEVCDGIPNCPGSTDEHPWLCASANSQQYRKRRATQYNN